MQKEFAYVIMLKITLVLVKIVFFGLKKGISGLEHWIAPKHAAEIRKFTEPKKLENNLESSGNLRKHKVLKMI